MQSKTLIKALGLALGLSLVGQQRVGRGMDRCGRPSHQPAEL